MLCSPLWRVLPHFSPLGEKLHANFAVCFPARSSTSLLEIVQELQWIATLSSHLHEHYQKSTALHGLNQSSPYFSLRPPHELRKFDQELHGFFGVPIPSWKLHNFYAKSLLECRQTYTLSFELHENDAKKCVLISSRKIRCFWITCRILPFFQFPVNISTTLTFFRTKTSYLSCLSKGLMQRLPEMANKKDSLNRELPCFESFQPR